MLRSGRDVADINTFVLVQLCNDSGTMLDSFKTNGGASLVPLIGIALEMYAPDSSTTKCSLQS